ncbi:hypothetical protein WJ971_17600 [Achromobacter xylosoxidans]
MRTRLLQTTWLLDSSALTMAREPSELPGCNPSAMRLLTANDVGTVNVDVDTAATPPWGIWISPSARMLSRACRGSRTGGGTFGASTFNWPIISINATLAWSITW